MLWPALWIALPDPLQTSGTSALGSVTQNTRLSPFRLENLLSNKPDFERPEDRRVVWPDSKTGGMSKPLSAEALRRLDAAPRYLESDLVIPSLFDGSKPMFKHTYSAGWRRMLERAGVPHCGTHAVRHGAATDIANSGVPAKVGMALTAHKTVTMFMHYVHTEEAGGQEAYHVNCLGLSGESDRDLMPRINEGDYTFATNNVADFRKLYGKQELHAELVIIIPQVVPARQRPQLDSLFDAVEGEPELVNQIVEITLEGEEVLFTSYDLRGVDDAD